MIHRRKRITITASLKSVAKASVLPFHEDDLVFFTLDKGISYKATLASVCKAAGLPIYMIKQAAKYVIDHMFYVEFGKAFWRDDIPPINFLGSILMI
jgi:hypothetical protein